MELRGLSTSQGNLLFRSLPEGVYPTCAELTGVWPVCFSHFSQERAPLDSGGWWGLLGDDPGRQTPPPPDSTRRLGPGHPI